jgi:O-antigen biosynthesis protein
VHRPGEGAQPALHAGDALMVRRIVRILVPLPVRGPLGRFLWRQRERLRRVPWRRWRKASTPHGAAFDPSLLELTLPESDPSSPLTFPTGHSPLVSILVPAHNQWEHTHRCLDAVLRHTEGVEYEVILADDASDDDTTRASELLEGVVIASGGDRRGYVQNCNAASKRARGDFLVLLNNDTVVQPGWLEAMLEVAKDEAVGIVGAKLVYEDGRLQEAGGMVFRDGSAANYGRDGAAAAPGANYVKDVDYVSGACLLVRADLWSRLGGFDSRYSPGYYEDVALAFEARRLGYRVVYQPRAVVVHFEGISHGRDTSAGVKRHQVLNAKTFREQWEDVLTRDHLEPEDEYVARDRSWSKPRILVVDHEVPQFDRDAGSRYVHAYLDLLLELGFHVVFLSSRRQPQEPYADELRQHGIEVVWAGGTKDANTRWLREHARYFDVVYVHRAFVAAQCLDAVRSSSDALVVYSPVDIHFVREERRWSVTGAEDARELAHNGRVQELEVLRGADIVHVVSSYEEELVRKLVPESVVRTLPIFVYEPETIGAPGFGERRHLMFVGGFYHEPNCDAAEWFVEEVFPLIRDELDGAFALIVGSNPPPRVMALAGDGVIVTGAVSERMLGDLYRQTRVVVCPLRYGAGVKGKLVEALHYQVPPVVTTIAAEGLPEIDEQVVIADQADEFARRTIELYSNRELWERYSARAAAYVQRHFSRDVARRTLELDLHPDRVRRTPAYAPGAKAVSARRVASR